MKKIFQKPTGKEKDWAPVYSLENLHLMAHYLSEEQKLSQEVFGLDEAAEYLKVKPSTLKNYTKKQMIAWVPVGKEQVFRKEDLDDFLKKRVKLHKVFY